jgi:hypothetical protein
VLRAKKGETGIVLPSFVYLPGVPNGTEVQKEVNGLEFFSTKVELGVTHLTPKRLSVAGGGGQGVVVGCAH